jgi:hypothetical protein
VTPSPSIPRIRAARRRRAICRSDPLSTLSAARTTVPRRALLAMRSRAVGVGLHLRLERGDSDADSDLDRAATGIQPAPTGPGPARELT